MVPKRHYDNVVLELSITIRKLITIRLNSLEVLNLVMSLFWLDFFLLGQIIIDNREEAKNEIWSLFNDFQLIHSKSRPCECHKTRIFLTRFSCVKQNRAITKSIEFIIRVAFLNEFHSFSINKIQNKTDNRSFLLRSWNILNNRMHAERETIYDVVFIIKFCCSAILNECF